MYLGGMIICRILFQPGILKDNICSILMVYYINKMKAPFDFGFISQYGRAFRVFDNQDSGDGYVAIDFYDGSIMYDVGKLPFQIRVVNALFAKFFVRVPGRGVARNG